MCKSPSAAFVVAQCAPVKRMDVLAPAEGLPGADHAVRARYTDFAICSCGGVLQICQWYRVCDAGALRAEPLGHPFVLRGQNRAMPMPRPETRASPSSAGTLLSTVMLLAIIVTTTWLRTGVAHDIVRPLSNVAEIPASPAQTSRFWQ